MMMSLLCVMGMRHVRVIVVIVKRDGANHRSHKVEERSIYIVWQPRMYRGEAKFSRHLTWMECAEAPQYRMRVSFARYCISITLLQPPIGREEERYNMQPLANSPMGVLALWKGGGRKAQRRIFSEEEDGKRVPRSLFGCSFSQLHFSSLWNLTLKTNLVDCHFP